MKRITFSNGGKIILFSLIIAITGCTKDPGIGHNPSPGPGPTQGQPPAAPAKLELKSDTALYNGVATVSLETDGQVVKEGNNVVNGNRYSIESLKRDTVLVFTATNSNQYGSAVKTVSVTIKVWSERTTKLQSYTPLHLTFSKSCVDGMQYMVPIPWVASGPIDPNFWVKFYANGGGQTSAGIYPAGTGWKWADANELSIDFGPNPSGPGDVWFVELLSNGFKRSQIKNGYYTLQIWEQ